MSDKCHMCLLGLIILCPLLTGTSGVNDTHVFCSSGENVRLPCNNARSNCTWNYSRDRNSTAVELIAGGIKKKEIERLSLGSNCSLNIKKVSKEDYGSYNCRQYVNGQQGTDARVHLNVLHVSSSSSQTEISPGSSVTLSCQLEFYEVPCDAFVSTEGIQLIWVNQAGVNLQTDSRYQISFSSTHCISTLTTTLLNEDHNRVWRCQVKQRNELKTSVTYTVKYSVSPKGIIVVAAALAVLLLAVILWVIRKKRADNRRETNDSVEHKADVTYTEVATNCKIQAKKIEIHDEDKVTYSSIR